MADPYTAAIARWTARNVPMLPGPEDEIRAAFAEMGQPLSNDVLKLYLTIGGFVDFECDGHWSLWSLNRMREMQPYRSDWHRQNSVLWFADFLIESHYYGILYVDTEHSAVCFDSGDGPNSAHEIYAESVGEFLEKYVQDPESVDALDLDGPPRVSFFSDWVRRIKSKFFGMPAEMEVK